METVIGNVLSISGSFGKSKNREEQTVMFDKIYKVIYDGNEVECGCVLGNDKVVYIKAGMGGSHLGYEDKYLKIATRLHDKYDCSVICVSNPVPLPISVDKKILCEFINVNGINNSEIFFFGHSNGGVKGLELAANGVAFKRMVLVNMPLMLNFHKTVQWINASPETNIVAVYGEKDPSYQYIPFLQTKNFQNVEIVKIADADHNFKGMIKEFIVLADKVMNEA